MFIYLYFLYIIHINFRAKFTFFDLFIKSIIIWTLNFTPAPLQCFFKIAFSIYLINFLSVIFLNLSNSIFFNFFIFCLLVIFIVNSDTDLYLIKLGIGQPAPLLPVLDVAVDDGRGPDDIILDKEDNEHASGVVSEESLLLHNILSNHLFFLIPTMKSRLL